MILKVKNFSTTDVGTYYCVSTNSLGRAEGTLRLYGNFETNSLHFYYQKKFIMCIFCAGSVPGSINLLTLLFFPGGFFYGSISTFPFLHRIRRKL